MLALAIEIWRHYAPDSRFRQSQMATFTPINNLFMLPDIVLIKIKRKIPCFRHIFST
jgi:hypothetical protein